MAAEEAKSWWKKGKVKLTYFKESGKYYTDEIYETDKEMMYDVYDEVRQMQREGKLPGLIEGCGQEFIILVTSEGVKHDVPQLIFPNRS
jgi:hypothetical protein